MTRPLSGNPSQRDCEHAARDLGVHVEHVHRTGETRWTHPAWQRPIVINSRRKDTPRALVVALRRLTQVAA